MIDVNELPDDPGCYLYLNGNKEIIYVGKAKSLKKRVQSYFSATKKDEKTAQLIQEIAKVNFFVTSTEVEALLLESTLIKKHQPRYNIDLKHSQRYAYIALTNEKFPRLRVARDKANDARYFGPFTTAQDRDTILKVLRKKFMVRTCNKLPKRECLRYHINLCSAPCTKKISEKDYKENIETIAKFLKGNTTNLLKDMKNKMTEFSKNLQFEEAKLMRDQLHALEYLNDRQKVEKDIRYDQDIINYIIEDNWVYLILFNISKGVLSTKREFSFPYHAEFFSDFIVQYYGEEDIPKELIIPYELNDPALAGYLEKKRKAPVKITVPRRGMKKELLQLVHRNIEVQFLKQDKMLKDLEKRLKLNTLPQVIECFDIAHIQGTSTAASMVQFRHAKPDKSNYRQFKIRTTQGIDDVHSIKEVVTRRYTRLKHEEAALPDLIMIDGGKGQLHAALSCLHELGMKIPVIALAKTFEEVYVPGLNNPLPIPKNSLGLQLLIQVRNEAHRFAQRYHKTLRSKAMLQ